MENLIGVDVGKYHLEICFKDKVEQIDNKIACIRKWIRQINRQNNIDLVVCEATGGYERILVKLLKENNISICVEHANKIRAFAKSKGLLAKTDKIDAQLILKQSQTMNPKPKSCELSKNMGKIRELLKRRDQLIEHKNGEEARLDKLLPLTIKHSIQSHIDFLNRQIQKIQRQIDETSSEKNIKEKVKLLTSIPGIGQQTVLMILAYMPELENANSKQLAALVGVAPFNRDSGCFRGKRFIQGGRKLLRKALYMASIASVRWNRSLNVFYSRLRSRGKCVKVALVAVMNKLLSMIKSVYNRQTPWVENLPQIA